MVLPSWLSPWSMCMAGSVWASGWTDPARNGGGGCCCIFSASAPAHGPGLWPCVSKPYFGICLFSTEWLPWIFATQGCLCQLRLAQCHLSFRKTSCVCHSGSRSFSSGLTLWGVEEAATGKGYSWGSEDVGGLLAGREETGLHNLCQALR